MFNVRGRLIQYIKSQINCSDFLLDAGSGDGWISSALEKDVRKVIKLDIWEPCEPDLMADLNNALPFKDNSFDVVLLLDVIEHLEKHNGIILIKELKRITKRIIILFTPLVWNENKHLFEDLTSLWYHCPWNLHKSLWGKENFIECGWNGNVFKGKIKYWLGTWTKSVNN